METTLACNTAVTAGMGMDSAVIHQERGQLATVLPLIANLLTMCFVKCRHSNNEYALLPLDKQKK